MYKGDVVPLYMLNDVSLNVNLLIYYVVIVPGRCIDGVVRSTCNVEKPRSKYEMTKYDHT